MNSSLEASSGTGSPLPLEPPGGGQTARSVSDAGAVLLAVFVVALLLTAISYGFHLLRINRGNQRRQEILARDAKPSTVGQLSDRPRRRKRRSLKTNPTLAETGGLPPQRPTP